MKVLLGLLLLASPAAIAKPPLIEGLAREVYESFVWPVGPRDIPFTLPKIKRVSASELLEACIGDCRSGPDASLRVAAYYKEGTIFLGDHLDIDKSARDRAILVHELTHYYQDMAGTLSPGLDCVNRVRSELQALEFQNRHLVKSGAPAITSGLSDHVGFSTGWCDASFNKATLAESLVKQIGLSANQASAAVDAILDGIDGSWVRKGKATYVGENTRYMYLPKP